MDASLNSSSLILLNSQTVVVHIFIMGHPFVGAGKPNESFSVFDGEEINGKWKLHVLNFEPIINVAAIEMELVYNPDQNEVLTLRLIHLNFSFSFSLAV